MTNPLLTVLYVVLMPIAWVLWHILFRTRYIGRENLIHGRGFILAPNHISMMDPIFLVVMRFWAKRMRIFAKKELYEKNWFVSGFLDMCGCVAVRGTKEEMTIVQKTIEECKNGRGLLIFPEGTRSRTGEIGPIKSGVFVIADQAAVDIIPCRIIYGTRDGRLHPFCRVRVCFGRPIPAAELSMGGKRDIARLRANKQRLADAWETLYQENRFDRRKNET